MRSDFLWEHPDYCRRASGNDGALSSPGLGMVSLIGSEHGIPPQPARPFLMPAFLLNRDKAIARVRNAINAAVRSALAKAGPATD